MLRPGRRITDGDREAWRVAGDPFAGGMRIEDAFLYCFDGIYRELIDPPRQYDLSKNKFMGADRAKLDLLSRFFRAAIRSCGADG